MPPKKPRNRRHNRHTRDLGLVPVPSSTVSVPPPRAGWLISTRASWDELWSAPIAGAFDVTSDAPGLLRLFELRDTVERYRRAVRKMKATLVKGSGTQPVLNPLLRQIVVLEQEIMALEDRFGLSPLARLRLGVEFGRVAMSMAELDRMIAEEHDEGFDEARLEAVRKLDERGDA